MYPSGSRLELSRIDHRICHHCHSEGCQHRQRSQTHPEAVGIYCQLTCKDGLDGVGCQDG
jgi:hypothetical protein